SYAWTCAFLGTGGGCPYGLTTDPSGNLLVTGTLGGTLDFDPGSGVDNRTSAGASDVFITKLAGDGRQIWTRTLGGASPEMARTVAADALGNVFVVGSFQDTVDFQPGPGMDERTSAGMDDVFLTKFSSDGSYAWTKTVGNTQADVGVGVATDASGAIFITGEFSDTVDLDPGPGVDPHTSAGGKDIFMTKLNPDGSYGWTKSFGGANGDGPYSILVDGAGQIYMAGKFQATVDFDPGPGSENHTSAGGSDAFLTAFQSNGTHRWTIVFGSADDDMAYRLALDPASNILVVGEFCGTIDFDPGAGTDNHTSAGLNDAFVSSFCPDASYRWTNTAGGTGADATGGLAVDPLGNVYMTGYFSDTADFDPGPGVDNRTSAGNWDIFIQRFSALPLDPAQTTAQFSTEEQAVVDSWQTWMNAPFAGTTGADISTDAENTVSIAVGDVNNDGWLDVVAGNLSATNKLYLNDGDGAFLAGADIGTDTDVAWAIALADMNNDGWLDLVVAKDSGQASRLYLNNGAGGFLAPSNIESSLYMSLSLAIGDINNDGWMDVVIGNYAQESHVVLNDGAGGFLPEVGLGDSLDNTSAIALGDVNNDGWLDIVTGNDLQADKLFMNDGTGAFLPGSPLNADSDLTRAVALSDMNRDGWLDVVVANYGQTNKAYMNDRAGGFLAANDIGAETDLSNSLLVGDVNEDGFLDVVVGNYGQTNKLYLGDGTGAFVP
ncbi:MAG: FG-GAP-like repeat-containing protein, partial [Planctomycetota bacterium]